MKSQWTWGRYSPLIALIATIGAALDQLAKIWVVHIYDMANNVFISVLPVLDIVLVWNRGVSYGLFQQDHPIGRWALAVFTVLAAIAIWVWGVRSSSKPLSIYLGLILAGAIGNGIDRIYYGQVVDYLYFHVNSFSWYVFNLADVWIVLGAAGLFWDSLFSKKKKKT
ncbi:signal peptidase II [Flexibacterium corallicola]|uniref:signal peptidase II n=1 Tax=Flexibacterium corallicola TaxID=3037259 RepID=UPI00286F7D9A|nr:signal peptidase II [Pseudovibrio sp. M1P-2-3]